MLKSFTDILSRYSKGINESTSDTVIRGKFPKLKINEAETYSIGVVREKGYPVATLKVGGKYYCFVSKNKTAARLVNEASKEDNFKDVLNYLNENAVCFKSKTYEAVQVNNATQKIGSVASVVPNVGSVVNYKGELYIIDSYDDDKQTISLINELKDITVSFDDFQAVKYPLSESDGEDDIDDEDDEITENDDELDVEDDTLDVDEEEVDPTTFIRDAFKSVGGKNIVIDDSEYKTSGNIYAFDKDRNVDVFLNFAEDFCVVGDGNGEIDDVVDGSQSLKKALKTMYSNLKAE